MTIEDIKIYCPWCYRRLEPADEYFVCKRDNVRVKFISQSISLSGAITTEIEVIESGK